MSSNYSISTSESSSFCTNPSLHQTKTRPVAAARGERPVEAAASSAQQGVTPKKASQSTRAATATQESPSMTIRRVPADYSKRMEDQKARSSALERYKMLVKANRLVPSDGEASPEPKKAQEKEDTDLSTTWRRSDQLPPSSILRDGSAASLAVLSDVSDNEEEEEERDAAATTTESTLRKSQGRQSADPRPPHSVSRRQPHMHQQRQRARSSSSSPVSVSVSVERPAYPASASQRQEHAQTTDAAAAVVPALDLNKTQAHQPVQQPQPQPASVTSPSVTQRPVSADDDHAEDAAMDYVSPELTQPFGKSNLKPRSSIRPGYEPVTEHRSASLTRTSSFTGDAQLQQQQQRTPRKQQSSQVRSRSSVAQGRQSASPNGPSTPRRKSAIKARAAEVAPPPENATASAGEAIEVAARHVDTTAASTTPEERVRREENEAVAPSLSKTDGGVVPLPGSKTAFWMRPSSAMYEMTTSIAAKRKDHVDMESITRTNSSRRTSRSYHAIPTGSSSSPCGTPRGRGGPGIDAAVAEDKPRFSTHLSAAERKLYEESVTVPPVPPVSTYDAIFSHRNSTVHRSSARRSQKVGSATADASLSSVASSTPRGTPRGAADQPRRMAQRADLVRSPSSLSRLSSTYHPHTPSEGQAAGAGRVSTRQQEALSKHCARVAAAGPAASTAVAPAHPIAAAASATEAKANKKTNMKARTAALPAQVQTQPPSGTSAAATVPELKASIAPVQPGQEVRKKLEYEATEITEEEEGGDGPVPQTVVPKSSKRITKATATPPRHANDNEEDPEASPHTTIHGRRAAGDDTTPSKSRRREHDTTASPPRDDGTDVARFTAQEEAMAREKEAARAQQARAALESCRLARQARVEATRTTHSAGASVSTNEVVAAMLQGIVQQTRQVLPCYLCGDLQCTSGYRVHVSACRTATEAALHEYFTTIGGLPDTPAEVKERMDELAAREVPSSTSDISVRDAFARECYQCVKSTLVPCRKCGTQLRVHDVKEHEMLCGRAYYQNSRAAERVRSAVDRIERGSQD